MMEYLIDGSQLAWPPVLSLIFLTLLVIGTDFVWRTTRLHGKVLLPGALALGTMGVSIILMLG